MSAPQEERKLAEVVKQKKLELRQGDGKRVVIAGGTGFVGRALRQELERLGYEVQVLSRSAKEGAIPWDAHSVGPWAQLLEGADAVVNLTGERIDQNWNSSTMPKILKSRVESSKAIGEAIDSCQNPPRVWLNASAVGYYGSRGDEELDEGSGPGDKHQFAVKVCTQWEDTVSKCRCVGTAKCVVRIGVVLGNGGGALTSLCKVTRMFLGGTTSHGRQWVPWIHLRDLVRLMVWCIQEQKSGPVVASAPNPVQNRQLMAAMRRACGRPWAPPTPRFLLNFVHFANGPHPSLLMDSVRAVPNRAIREGFLYDFPNLEEALGNLLG